MNRSLRLRGPLTAVLVVAGLTAGVLGVTAAPGATARAATAPPPGSSAPCEGSGVYCTVPNVALVGPASKCGNPDYYGTSDGNSVPIAWTYASGSTVCTGVAFTVVPESVPVNSSCQVYFYVPDGDATATFTLTASLYNGGSVGLRVSEAPYQGWIGIGAVTDPNGYFVLEDDNGQSYPAKIGWGTTTVYSIWLAC